MSAGTDSQSSSSAEEAKGRVFVTTRWSLVLAAARNEDSTECEAALGKLCQTYWQPIYMYVRRRGFPVEDAQDLTQGFFEKLLARGWLASADQKKGRFRTFLLTAVERFVANEWDKAQALKRGGGEAHLPIQVTGAEERYGVDPEDTRTPEQIFEYHWAVALLDEVLKSLAAEHDSRGQKALFDALKPCLVGERSAHPYAELAAQLAMRETAVKVAVHRLRQRYRELLRAEIAQTLDSAEEVDAEMKHLFRVLAQNPGS